MPARPDLDDLTADLVFTVDGHTSDWRQMFLVGALRGGLPHMRFDQWPTEANSLNDLQLEPFRTRRDENEINAIAWLDAALATICIEDGSVGVTVAARSPEECDAALEGLRVAIRPRELPSDGSGVGFGFWSSGEFVGANREIRILEVPAWAEIDVNYARPARDSLARLVASGQPAETAGRALLWHGEPGTGKTYALRALAREWRHWCDVHVVVDAERFLSNASYMDEVLAHRAKDERWRLIALEDTGELLTADARERVGQGLSRLLNATDGLLGQGTRSLVLITTNEPVVHLHPAISRPGRCLAEIEFEPLPVADANEWLAERCNGKVDRATPIAELYEIASGQVSLRRRRLNRVAAGFAARNGI